MEKLIHVENGWDGELDCPEVMGPCCLNSEEEVAAAIKRFRIVKSAGPTGVVSEMMKSSGGFGTRWMTDLINNIVKEDWIPDDWRKSILVPVYKGKCDPLMCGSYRAIRLLEQAMKVLEQQMKVLETGFLMIREIVFWCQCTRGNVIHLCAVHTEQLGYWSRR